MTSRKTASARLCPGVFQVNFILAKEETLTNSSLLIGCMHIMTCAAGPALFLFHMKCVQIYFSISKVCYGFGVINFNKEIYMTEETEAIFTLFIFSIKHVRKSQSENKGVV